MAADVDDLRLVAPQDFVAARNAVVKALRTEGRRDDAGAVAKLRRPSPVDWALNTVAVRSPQVVAAVVAAHAHLREVQERAVRDRAVTPDLRGAAADTRSAAGALRVAADQVLKAGGRPSSDASALATRVNEISVDPTLLAQLQAGRLGTAPVEPVDPFAELVGWAVQTPVDQEVPAGTGAAPPVTASVKRPDRSAQRRAQAVQRRRDQAVQRLEVAERELEAARRELEEASARVRAAQRDEQAARERSDSAEHRRDRAAAELADLESALTEAQDHIDR